VAQNSRPACLLYGEKEKRFRPHMEFAQQAMPALEITRLDAGHGMNMEAPDAFNAAVIDFICRCAT
jgi:pimeloyl-ACP methyl ester carboxylesterase